MISRLEQLNSTEGKVLFKIYEIFLDKSVREKFKDILFDRFEKLCND